MITLFVREWDGRAMQVASDNSWARHRLKHLSWRSQWIIPLHTWTRECQLHAKSHEPIAVLWFVLLTSQCSHRYVPCAMPDVVCLCLVAESPYHVAVLQILFSRPSTFPSFHSTTFVHHTLLTARFLIWITFLAFLRRKPRMPSLLLITVHQYIYIYI